MFTFKDLCEKIRREWDVEHEQVICGDFDVSRAAFRSKFIEVQNEILKLGIDGKHIVSVEIPNSWEWIAAMLAIVDAGHVYTAIPSAEDGIGSLVSIRLATDRSTQTLKAVERPRLGLANLAPEACYLIPTSGSTGDPKAIIGSRTALEQFVNWELDELAPGRSDIFSVLSAQTFDPVFREVLVPLASGARLAISSGRKTMIPSGTKTVNWLAKNKVTIIHAVPTLIREWINGRSSAALAKARAVLCAGEPLYEADLVRWVERFGSQAEFYNLYGPSETTLAKFAKKIDLRGFGSAVVDGAASVGKPLPGASFIILEEGKVCGPYQVGEVNIRTPYASLGYLSNLGTVDSPFIKNPFDDEDTVPVFPTRDLGYTLPNGELILTGRLDGVYKFRGIRTSLSDIENMIRAISGILDAAVAITTDSNGSERLSAFYVGNLAESDMPTLVRLQSPKVAPSRWVKLESLPRTASRKIDRRSLSKFRAVSEIGSDSGPTSGIIDAILTICSRVLGIEKRIEPLSRIQDMGGQSIEAVQIAELLEEMFGVPLELDEVLDDQTPLRLAERIGRRIADQPAAAAGMLRLNHFPNDDSLPVLQGTVQMTGSQERFWKWIGQHGMSEKFQFLWAGELRGLIDAQSLARKMSQLIAGADGQWIEPVEVEGYAPAIRQIANRSFRNSEVRVIDVSSFEQARVDAQNLAREPFNFGAEPLARSRIYRMNESHHVLIVVNHVLGSDGWTKSQMLSQVSEMYNTGAEYCETPSYLEYARLESESRNSWHEKSSFLHANLKRLDPVHPVAANWPEVLPPSSDARTIELTFDNDEVSALRANIDRFGSTIAAAVASALTFGLREVFGGSGPVLVSNANRRRPDWNTCLGSFTDSTMIFYGPNSSDPVEQLRTVGAYLSEAVGKAKAGFYWTVKNIRDDIDPNSATTFPVIFAPQPNFASELKINGVSCDVMPWSEHQWIWPLEVYPVIDHDSIVVSVTYAADRFSDQQVSKLAESINKRLQQLIAID